MMSSEEDVTVDSFGVVKKSKRSRQRVDAGEPRNSYSSIPNFSSRPNLINSGIYGALFAAPNHQNFVPSGAYFNPGYGPTKMLNELLSRRVKTIADNSDAMMTIDVAGNDVSAISGSAYDCLNNQSPVGRVANSLNGGGGGGSPPVAEMEQHKLWNILQGVGRKKDLYALEQKLRGAGNNNNNNCDLSGADCANEANALTNNNNNNNNNNVNNNNNNANGNSNNVACPIRGNGTVNTTTASSTFNNNNNTNSINNNINNNNAKKANKNNNNNEEEKINEENGCAEENVEIRSCENSKESLTNGDVDDMEMVDAEDRNDVGQESNEVSPPSDSTFTLSMTS